MYVIYVQCPRKWAAYAQYSQPIHCREKGEKIILSSGGVSKITGKGEVSSGENKTLWIAMRDMQ
jgi:ribosomal protein S27E